MKQKIFAEITHLFEKKDPSCQPPEAKAETTTDSPDTEEFERCILCGRLTDIPVSMPIDLRENYEIGCGQVCISCMQKLHDTKEI